MIAALSIGAAVIVFLSTIMGGLFVWGIPTAIAVILLAAIVTIGKVWAEKKVHSELPRSLAPAGFAYPQPPWLTDLQRDQLSELAKAAFVLLLFEQTESGCWSKSYLSRHLARGEKLPLAHGALTGTPFALLAISSYAGESEFLVREATYHLLFETLARLLGEEGDYLKGYQEAFGGRSRVPERPRHAAGACLITLMYGEVGLRDLKTIEAICSQPIEPASYDWAMVSRLLLQVRHTYSIPIMLRAKAGRRLKKLLASLTLPMQTPMSAHIWARPSDLHSDSINQWGTVWWILPSLVIPNISLALRVKLSDRLRSFLLAQSAAEPTGIKLLHTEFDESGNGTGNSAFGSGLALVAWRTLESYELGDSKQSKTQGMRMVNRILGSKADVIESPSSNVKPQTLEGYLGWAAICLAAASVGIQISPDDCRAAVSLTQELNAVAVNNCTQVELESAYKPVIDNKRLLSPELADSVARVAAKVGMFYKAVNDQRESTSAEDSDGLSKQ